VIRIVCTEVDAGAAANVGGPVHVRMKTFDVDIPELEAWLAPVANNTYLDRSVAGVEVRTGEETRG
jgi:hypothetical protein